MRRRGCISISCILCGYGVYIGRYLRFNSWDAFTNPCKLIYTMAHHVFKPHEPITTCVFTILLGVMFGIVYFTLQQLKMRLIQADPI